MAIPRMTVISLAGGCSCRKRCLRIVGLWDFAWWVYQEVNFLPRITQIALIFYFFSREFALFAVDFSSTMRNPKEPRIVWMMLAWISTPLISLPP